MSIVFYGLMREVPQIAATLASGRFTMAGGGIATALGTAAAVTAGVALAATGAGVAGYAAMKGAMSQEDTADNEAAISKMAIDTTGEDPPPSGGGGGKSPSPEPAAPTANSNASSSFSSGAPAPSSDAGTSAGGNNSAPASSSTAQKLTGAAWVGAKAVGGAALKGAKNAALHGAMSLSEKSAIGAMFARAGVDMMKPDTGDPKQHSMEIHKKLMAQLQKDNAANFRDSGNDPNNYRNVTEDIDARRERFDEKPDA